MLYKIYNDFFIVVEVKYGEGLNLVCGVIGNPEPQFSWKHVHENGTVTEFETGKKLQIFSFEESNEGRYVCNAKSSVGKDIELVFNVTGLVNG